MIILAKPADGEKILRLIKNKIRQSRKILSRKIEHFFDQKSEKFNAVFGQILGTF